MARPQLPPADSQTEAPPPPAASPVRGSSTLPRTERGRDVAARPRSLPRPPFWLVCYPGRWCVLAGEVVPALEEFVLEHGINGVVVSKDGTISTDDAEHNIRAAGGFPIAWDVDAEPYLHEPTPGVWVPRWTRLTGGSDHVSTDLKGYVGWIRDLQSRGILPHPERRHLETLISRVRSDVEQSSQNPAVQPHRVVQLRAELEVIEAELATVDAGPPEASSGAGLPRTASHGGGR